MKVLFARLSLIDCSGCTWHHLDREVLTGIPILTVGNEVIPEYQGRLWGIFKELGRSGNKKVYLLATYQSY